MSLEDVFGSDLEDSEDEERVKSDSEAAKKAEINELFGDSPSEGEEEDREEREITSDQERDQDQESGEDDDAQNGIADREEAEREEAEREEAESEEEEEKDEDTKPSLPNELSHVDLFGYDDEELSSEEEKEQERETVVAQQEDDQQRVIPEGEEEEEEETRINVTIPYCRVSLGSELYFSKLPNFLSLETKPFDPALYEDDIEDDEILDEEGRARLKLKVENTIRWRYGKDQDDNEIKESNARVVRWSDGSMSLLLGAEVFDIQKTRIEGDFNHLFVQQGTGLQGQAVFKEKLTFRPHSTASQTHRKMTLSIADRVAKAQKIRILPAAGKDPEAQRNELIKKEDERLRAQLRVENQQRRMRERSQAKGLNTGYLEDDDDDELEQSLLKIKKKYKNALAKGTYSSEDEEDNDAIGGLESDEEEEGEERLLNAKEGIESEEEVEEKTSRKRPSSEGSNRKEKKKTKKIIESSDEESD